MLYKKFQDEELSVFAMGCMRLPVIDGDDANINEQAAAEMVAYAIEHGVTYFDTAWGYHGGNSECVVGKILARYPRESFNLASKFPGYDLANMGKTEEIFEEQLRKCGVDYFDFYLVHNVCEMNIEQYLDDAQYGTLSYLIEQKKRGRIRHLGFSAHGTAETICRFLEAYGQHMEFCQLQLNYFDYTFQDTKGKMAVAQEWGLPIWVMEPLRGGSLFKLSAEEEAKLRALHPDWSAVEWALRWLQAQPEVTCILCGSSTLEQISQNIALLSEEKPLGEQDFPALQEIVDARVKENVQPCTKCRYCVSHCPIGIDIPWMLELYNEHKLSGGGFIAPMALAAVEEGKKPADCIACGACAAVCPQQIDIPGVLADFTKLLAE